MTLAELEARQSRIRAEARAKINQITDETPDDEARKIERDFNAMMLEYDDLTAKISEARAEADQTPDPRRPRHTAEARGADDGIAEAPDEPSFGIAPAQRMTTWAKAKTPDDPHKGLGLGRYLRAMAVGGQTEAERRALAEGSDSSGGYTVPTTLSARLIDALRAQSVVTRAGAQMVPLSTDTHSIAAVATDPVPAWRVENEAVTESDPTFRNVPFAPKSLAVMTKVSQELLEDSLNLENALPQIMAAAMAVEMDRVCLLGSGTDPEPKGIANTSGIGTTAHDATLDGYTPMLTARTGILSANAGPVSAVIMHPRDEGTLTALTDSTGQPLDMPRALTEVPMLTTTSIPTDGGTGSDESTIFVGNFAHLLIGMRSQIRVFVSRDLHADHLQYTYIAHMRMDVALAHAAGFHTITGVQG